MTTVQQSTGFKPWIIAIASTVALGLGSCATNTDTDAADAPPAEPANGAASESTPESTPEPAAEIQVVTTFLPMTQFTTAVAGDRAEITQLLPTNVGPHDYQAKPADAQAIANADVLVKNGLEMEFFLDDLIANAGNTDLVIIDSSNNIDVLTNDEAHSHDHAEDAHGHDHDHAEDAHAHDHGAFDPHIWLDPKRAIEQVENIRDGLIAIDPEGEAVYTENAAAYIAQLQALDADIAQLLAPYSGRTFVVFHDFADYFADSYGLQSEFLVGIPEQSPSPEDVKRVMDTVQSQGLKTILTEPQAGESAFESIANDLDIAVSVFDPVATGSPDAIAPGHYFTVMRQNSENLAIAFEQSAQSSQRSWASPVAALPAFIGIQLDVAS